MSQSVAVHCCNVSGGFIHYGHGRGPGVRASQCLCSGLGAAIQHLAARHRHRRRLRCHHLCGSGGERVPDEDVSVGQVHAHRAKLVSHQLGSGGRAAPRDLRPGGRQPLPGGRVALWPRWLQVDPVHSAHLGGGVRVHSDRTVRRPVIHCFPLNVVVLMMIIHYE